MNLADVRAAYYEKTAKASDITRQLGFAGIAIIWVFKTEVAGLLTIPNELRLAGVLVVISLALDFLQYVYASSAWGIFHRFKEKERDNKEARGIAFTDDFQAPDQINWPTLIFFWMKLTVLSIAYGIMIASVFQELS